jgi:hypothetical protein
VAKTSVPKASGIQPPSANLGEVRGEQSEIDENEDAADGERRRCPLSPALAHDSVEQYGRE